ncbi:MAG: amino acid ABC transporter permease [Synergistaceae bacterium]|jgi:L-cystine transport system permease protein|nr:amino acid ABC transporter permease [Synergistaceae bacterium]
MSFQFDFPFARRAFAEALLGIPVTLSVVLAAFLAGFPLGFLIARCRLRRTPVISQILTVYVSFARGTPVVVKILLFYSLLPPALEHAIRVLGLNFSIYDLNPIVYAFIIFGITSSATYSEIWRSALNGVDSGQYEAAVSVGLTPFQAYLEVVLPQALAIGAPAFCSSTLSMLKGTSVVFLMAILDITGRARLAAAMGYKYLEAYVVIFLVYLTVCGILEQVFKLLEQRLVRFRAS